MQEPLRVLVAEDEALIRMDVVATLNESGYQVVGEAADGEEALRLADELVPDVVVMDIKMPELDGISAAEKLAEKKIPVVLLTAFSQQDLVARAVEAGALAYITKPFKPTDLLPAIQVALARNEEIVALEQETWTEPRGF